MSLASDTKDNPPPRGVARPPDFANAKVKPSVPCYHSTTSGVPPSAGTRGRNGLPTNRFKPQLCDRRSPMPEAAYSSIMTEAVAVFHDVESFQAPIDDLLPAGFDHADINVLAHEDTIRSKLGPMCISTAEFEDDPDAPASATSPMKPSATPKAPSSARASICRPCSAV